MTTSNYGVDNDARLNNFSDKYCMRIMNKPEKESKNAKQK